MKSEWLVRYNMTTTLVSTMKLSTQFSIPAQTSDLDRLIKPNPPTKAAKKRAKFKDKTYKSNARI